MDSAFVSKLLSENRQLSTLPQTIVEVLRVVRDENSSATELARVIRIDPALTSSVLRIVNSPFYGCGHQIGSITQAVMTMGMQQVVSLALSHSVYKMNDDWRSSPYHVRYWRHSLEVAITSRMIAERVAPEQAEQAFVAGLLHDIGLLILEQTLPDQAENMLASVDDEAELLTLEIGAWGATHAEIGSYLLRLWQLPESICEAVERHHECTIRDDGDEEYFLSRIVCLAHLISKFPVLSDRGIDATTLLDREVLRAHLGIPGDVLQAIDRESFSRTLEEAAFLEINIGSADDIASETEQMLSEQHEALRSLQKQIVEEEDCGQPDSLALNSMKSSRASAASLAKNIHKIAASMQVWIAAINCDIADTSTNAIPADALAALKQIMEGNLEIAELSKEIEGLTVDASNDADDDEDDGDDFDFSSLDEPDGSDSVYTHIKDKAGRRW